MFEPEGWGALAAAGIEQRIAESQCRFGGRGFGAHAEDR